MNLFTVLARPVAPSGDGAFIKGESGYDGLDRTTPGEQGDHYKEQILAFTQTFKHCAGSFTKGFTTDFTAVTLALAVMNGDVALLFKSSFGTMLVRAELLTSVHRY